MSSPAQVVVLRFVLALSVIVVPAQAAWTQPRIAVNDVDAPAGVTVAAGAVARVAVSDGPANTTDWIGFYPVGAADSGYLAWQYLNGATSAPATGVISATLHVLVPVSPGTYEVRLFAANGYTRLATSGPITVEPSSATIRVNDIVPPAALQIGPASPLTATLTNGPGNPADWVGLFAVGTADTSSLSWQYLNGTTTLPSAGLTAATLPFFTPSAPGTYELRWFAGGGYARLAVSATLVVGPSEATLAVNGVTPPAPVTATAGSVATVTVTGAPGNPTDWIGLYAAGAADTASLQWRYLNGALAPPSVGIGDALLSVLMPTVPGAYEVRLFAHNAYDRLASSSVVTVPASSAHLAVNGVDAPGAVTVAAGTPLTVVLTDGPANPSDWVGLFAAAAADAAPIVWSYLNGHTTPPAQGLATATFQFLAPVTAGPYEIRAFTANTFQRLAASGPLSVTPSAAMIAVNGTTPPAGVSVPPASTLAIQVTAGPANPTDWVGLYRASDADAAPLTWQYLNGLTAPPAAGVSAAALTMTLPADSGTYEVRLFANNSDHRLATSSTVSAGAPAVTVSVTSPFPGTVVPVGGPIPLSADVAVSNGTVTAVEFQVDGSTVGSAVTSPYAVTWDSALVGAHVLVAVVVDSQGGRTSSAPVSVVISPAGPGVLGPPILTPPGGTFGADQIVTISAAPGATVRVTVDGSEPNEASPLYVGPLPIVQDTTVMARAFQDGWLASPPASATFVIDRTPPTILTFLIPEANVGGWHNSPVTVSFRCTDASGMRSCPAPVRISADGSTDVEGVAVDTAGNQSTITTTVHVDRTAPSLVVSGDTVRQTPDVTVTLTGSVADDGAGVARVTCNGAQALLDATGAFTCEVPVQPGLNAVVVQATDLAGNGRSARLRVTRVVPVDAIQVSPVSATIGVGESRALWSLDQTGQAVSNVEWTVDNSAVLALTTSDGRASVAGLSAGIATVTATRGTLTAAATITVVTGSLPTGTVRWTSAPGVPGAVVSAGPLFANRADASVPDLYVIENTLAGSQLLHGVFADGTPGRVWTVSPDASSFAALSLADRDGGVLLDMSAWSNGSQRAVVRIPGRTDALAWRYDLSTTEAEVVGQSPDGTIYLIEHVGQSWQVVGLDGDTGVVKFRYTPPGTSFSASYNVDCHAGYHSISESGPELRGGVVGYDGALYALASTYTSVHDDFSQPGCHASGATPTYYQATVAVVRVTAEGVGSLEELQTQAGSTGDVLDLHANTLVPDPRGGVHAQWDSLSFNWSTYEQTGEIRHARVGAGAAGGQQIGVLPFDRIGDGVGFDANGVAYDLDTTAVKFSPAVAGTFVTALAGGGVAVTDGQTLTNLDENGDVVGTPVPMPTACTYGYGLWVNGLSACAGPVEADYSSGFPDWNYVVLEPSSHYVDTPQQAVAMFFDRYFVPSQVEEREFGGLVCKLDSPSVTLYTTSPFVKGPPCTATKCTVDTRLAQCPLLTTKVEDYHTHPFNHLATSPDTWPQGPSGSDVQTLLDDNNIFHWRHGGYVGTFCGEVYYYYLNPSPPPLPASQGLAGNVYRPPNNFQIFSTRMFGEAHPQCSLSSPPQRFPLQVLR